MTHGARPTAPSGKGEFLMVDKRRYISYCRDCRKCVNPQAANFARDSGRVLLFCLSGGLSEIVLLFTPKCRLCGHRLSLHLGRSAQHVHADIVASGH